MESEGDINSTTATNVKQNVGRKHHKRKNNSKRSEEVPLEPTSSEALTSYSSSVTEVSDDERGEEPMDVTPRMEWIAKVDAARQAVEILGKRLNKVDGKFKSLEEFTLEKNNNIRKELEVRKATEYEIKEVITFLECRLMDALSTMDTMKAEMGALKGDIDAERCMMSKFRNEFKKSFFPNNVIYEAKHKFQELKQTGSIRAYVKEFTTLTLQILNLTDESMLFHFMDGLQSWARKELERRHVSTIDEAITQAEALTDFKHDKHDRGKGKETRSSHAKGGGDRGKGKEQHPPPKSHDSNKSNDRRFRRQGYAERKEKTTKGNGCYICGGPHGYARCLEMKNLGAILRERKDKELDQGQGSDMTQLGMIGLCGAIAKQTEKVGDYSAQYIDISINGRPSCAMVDSGAEANIMTKTAAARLGLSYESSNTLLKTVNASLTPVCGVSHGVDITLGKWQVKMPRKEGQAHLSAMQLVRGLKKWEPTFVATIVSLDEGNGAKETLPPCIEKVLEENRDVMPEELPRHLPLRREVDHKIELELGARTPAYPLYHMVPPELEELKKQLKEFLEEKCEFTQHEVHFLGYVISHGELRMDEAKVWAIKEWEVPTKSEECKEAFEDLKAAVIEEPILALPDFSKTFEVHTDASDYAIGGVLMQERHPIAFESRKLNETERRYTVQEKEMIAIQARWQDFLAEFDYELEYKPGKGNVVADALSRKFKLAAITTAHCDIQDAIKNGLQHDPEAKKLMELAVQGKTRRFRVEDGLLLTAGRRIYVPKFGAIKRQIMKESHDTLWAGYPGQRHTRQDKVEQRQPGGLMDPLPIVERPWESVTMDFITCLPKSDGYGTIMVVVDRFSKYVSFMPATVGCTAKEAARLFFKNVVKYWGLPRHIISDRDPRFTRNFWRELFKILGTKLHFSTSFHPQTDGQME
ncbi:uncharacterized protein LOC129890490 [Solanum dulcamara]|uniref:uncharacterized protein LOC129890490 n=1 Tax=Solanum dulcamara TaxID=45834 RepID=UPI00248587F5|nr:uncharacterized protein LOC129890490 [Solanum dulcamara]